jgi:hypothetical protein
METLRDKLAMAALVGVMADPSNRHHSMEESVRRAYAIADTAMLVREEAPNKKPGA